MDAPLFVELRAVQLRYPKRNSTNKSIEACISAGSSKTLIGFMWMLKEKCKTEIVTPKKPLPSNLIPGWMSTHFPFCTTGDCLHSLLIPAVPYFSHIQLDKANSPKDL